MNADADLIAQATDAIAKYGDGVKHTVACALMTKDGHVYTGVNVFTQGGGAHAELSALSMAISNGHPEVELLVAVGDNGRGVIAACGLCRQMLFDYAPDAEMIAPWNGDVKRVPIASLLPNAERSWFMDL